MKGIYPAAGEDVEDCKDGWIKIVKVPTAVIRDGSAAEGLHAEQREDEHEDEQEHTQIGDLRDRLDEAHHDLVQPRPCLEQPQQTEEAKHP